MIRTLLLLVLLAPYAMPQKFVHWWDGSYTEALREARIRNVPLILAFNNDGEEANDRIVVGLYKDPTFIKLTEKCVPMIACLAIHKTMKQSVRGHVRSCCSRFGAISCSRHRKMDMQAREIFWPDMVKTPSHIVIDPDGKEVGRIIDVSGASDYAALVAKVQKKLGRGMSANVYHTVKTKLSGVDRALRKKHYPTVIETLKAVEKVCRKHPLEKRVQGYWEQVNSAGAMIMARAQAFQKQNEHLKALRLLSRSIDEFSGARVQASLKTAARRLKKSRGGREAEKILKREARARPDFLAARKAELGGDYVKAASLYHKVVTRAAETPLAAEAEARLETLRKDPDIGKLILDADRTAIAMRLYRDAVKLIRKGERSSARELLKKIIADYPGTPAAKKASVALEKAG